MVISPKAKIKFEELFRRKRNIFEALVGNSFYNFIQNFFVAFRFEGTSCKRVQLSLSENETRLGRLANTEE